MLSIHIDIPVASGVLILSRIFIVSMSPRTVNISLDTEKVVLHRVHTLQFAATCCSYSKVGNYYEKGRMRGNIS
jgi:hypothetical protein